LIEELAGCRDDLVEARESSLWAALYPKPLASDSARPRLVTGELMEPLKRTLGLTSQVDIARFFDALRADVDWCLDAATPAQRAALQGRSQRDLHGAVWSGTPEGEQQARQDREAAIKRYTETWGRPPA
jgi:hypothetical protein